MGWVIPKIISVDDHVVEPAHVWQELPERHKQVAEQLMAGVPQDVADKVMRGNAIRMLSLDL